MVGKIFFSYSVNKSFFVLLIVPSNWYVRFMPQTTKVCHQKLKCQQEQRQRQEELGRGLLQCPPPVLVTVAWKLEFCLCLLSRLLPLLFLASQCKSELAAPVQASGPYLEIPYHFQRFFFWKPKSGFDCFSHCFGIYLKVKLPMNTLDESIRGSWEASLYVWSFLTRGRLWIWICLASTLCSALF